jgi:hypothetical protein
VTILIHSDYPDLYVCIIHTYFTADGHRKPLGLASAPARRTRLAAASSLKLTGLAQNLGHLYASYRDSQSNCWVNLRVLGRCPGEFHLL